jgi:hypothetical protein
MLAYWTTSTLIIIIIPIVRQRTKYTISTITKWSIRWTLTLLCYQIESSTNRTLSSQRLNTSTWSIIIYTSSTTVDTDRTNWIVDSTSWTCNTSTIYRNWHVDGTVNTLKTVGVVIPTIWTTLAIMGWRIPVLIEWTWDTLFTIVKRCSDRTYT